MNTATRNNFHYAQRPFKALSKHSRTTTRFFVPNNVSGFSLRPLSSFFSLIFELCSPLSFLFLFPKKRRRERSNKGTASFVLFFLAPFSFFFSSKRSNKERNNKDQSRMPLLLSPLFCFLRFLSSSYFCCYQKAPSQVHAKKTLTRATDHPPDRPPDRPASRPVAYCCAGSLCCSPVPSDRPHDRPPNRPARAPTRSIAHLMTHPIARPIANQAAHSHPHRGMCFRLFVVLVHPSSPIGHLIATRNRPSDRPTIPPGGSQPPRGMWFRLFVVLGNPTHPIADPIAHPIAHLIGPPYRVSL